MALHKSISQFLLIIFFCITLTVWIVNCQRSFSSSSNRGESTTRTTTEYWLTSTTTRPGVTASKIQFFQDRDRVNSRPNSDYDSNPFVTTTLRSHHGYPYPPRRPNEGTRPGPDIGWIKPDLTPRPSPPEDLPPKVNFTALDSSGSHINMTWIELDDINETKFGILKKATIYIRNLREIQLVLICNASYPIEWFSQDSYGTEDWETDEYRHFPNDDTIIYSLILKLKYDKRKADAIPKKMSLVCRDLKNYFSGALATKKQTLLELSISLDSDFLKADVLNLEYDLNEDAEYSEPIGANAKCNLNFKFNPMLGNFVCSANEDVRSDDGDLRKHRNLTIDYDNKCYDFASCRRKFSQSNCQMGSHNSRARRIEKVLMPSDLWSESNNPAAGFVFCQEDGNYNLNETAAKGFFHSLPPLCPQDDAQTRRKLYVVQHLGYRPDLRDLRRDFVSFCSTSETKQMYNPNSQGFRNDISNREFSFPPTYSIYAGENITVSCFSSLYHFAKGTRIKVHNGSHEEYTKTLNPTMEKLLGVGRGYYNFTAKVSILSHRVQGLICENYLKRSADSIQKYLRIQVKLPRNITFIGGLNQLAYWNYSGQPGFQLKCEADGDPVPKINWKKQGKPVPEIIQTVSSENNGRSWSILKFPSSEDFERGHFSVENLHGAYTCEAYNKLDIAEKVFHVGAPNSTSAIVPVVDISGNAIPLRESDESAGESWIVWAVVVPILLIIAGVVIGFLVWKIKKQGKELKALSKSEVDEFIFGKPEFLQQHHSSSSEQVNNYAPYLPYNKSYEIEKDQLEFDPENGVLGSGAYAVVLRGTLKTKSGDSVKVAIKTAKPMDDMSFFKALLSELKIMGFIGTHNNIVNLLGAHTKNIVNREVFICIEYCGNGNMLEFLRNNRENFVNLVGPQGNIIQVCEEKEKANRIEGMMMMSTLTLMKWAHEVAMGMEFLSSKKVIHGDLAARNILLDEYFTAKIGDFGLSRQLFEYTNYIKKQQSPLPWKWLAIESLQDMRFSVKSDVWAYSILLFEIFSLGKVPYPGYSYNDEFIDALLDGKRPNRPAFASNEMYGLMEKCWKVNPEERPNFTWISQFLNEKVEEIMQVEYLDLHEKITTVSSPTTASLATTPAATINDITGKERNRTRFSLNTKTITAVFHRT